MIHAHTLSSDPVWSADVVIVGSGAAGSAFSLRLASKGLDVLALEEGGHYTKADFNQREEAMYRLLYRDGANQMTRDNTVTVLQGRCIGGSTVVNMADVERIPAPILAHWRRLTGITDFNEATFRPYFEEAERMIGVNKIADEAINRNNALLREGAKRLGWRGDTMRHNRVGCIGSGYCLIGCSYDAKQSTLITYVPKAEAAGARFVAGARVERVTVEAGVAREVQGDRIDPHTGQIVGKFRVKAKHIVLAAGAIHTPLVLLRSGLTDGPVGKNLSLQPQVGVLAIFASEVRAYRGIPQSYYVDEFEIQSEETGLGGYRLEGIAGGPGMSAVSIGLWGAAHQEIMRSYLRTAALLVLVPDRPGGEVRALTMNRAEIRYRFQDVWKRTALQGVRQAARAYLEAGAQKVFTPGFPARAIVSPKDLEESDLVRFDSGSIRAISAHPQGTCRIGTHPEDSVVDPDGRHHAVKNLYVIDASLFPTTASTHTTLPILATATWLADKFLARA